MADGFLPRFWNGIAERKNQHGGNTSGYATFRIPNSLRTRLLWVDLPILAKWARKKGRLSIVTLSLIRIMRWTGRRRHTTLEPKRALARSIPLMNSTEPL